MHRSTRRILWLLGISIFLCAARYVAVDDRHLALSFRFLSPSSKPLKPRDNASISKNDGNNSDQSTQLRRGDNTRGTVSTNFDSSTPALISAPDAPKHSTPSMANSARIHHFQGLRHNLDTKSQVHLSSTTPQFVPGKLHFFSYADHFKKPVCLLTASLNRYGYHLNMLAWNESNRFRSGHNCTAAGCTERADPSQVLERKVFWQNDLFQNYAQYGVEANDLIVFMDAYDVLLVNDPSRLVELFLHHTQGKRGIVFNGEPTCGDGFLLQGDYGERLRQGMYNVQLSMNHSVRTIRGYLACPMMAAKSMLNSPARGPFFALNSGVYIGDALSLQRFFTSVMEEYDVMDFGHHGDQLLYQLVYLKDPSVHVVVDTDASMFYTFSYLYGDGDIESIGENGCTADFLTNGQPFRVRFDHETEPLFVHFPGHFKHYYSSCATSQRSTLVDYLVDPRFIDFDRQQEVSLLGRCDANRLD